MKNRRRPEGDDQCDIVLAISDGSIIFDWGMTSELAIHPDVDLRLVIRSKIT